PEHKGPQGERKGPPPQQGKNISISISGNKVKIDRGDPKFSPEYILGEEVDEQGFGSTRKAKATLADNVLTIESRGDKDTTKRVYALSGSELVVTLSSTKPGVPEARRIYKKVN
ncbi:hypothetical protein GWI33_010734, partial [Rhynchophorus ferrugineus]